jgi:dihydrofolate synthase/folylpolyglutamate synthase
MQDDFADLIPRFDLRGMDLQLDRMQAALRAMGSPCGSIPAIQVAGTNGKGSIACFLASALQKAGIRTGLTISPHLVSWCERIRVDGQQISPARLRQRLIALQEISRLHRLTPFEQLLATSFAHFDDERVELMVLEVGLGGRLDATTAHPLRPVIAMAAIGLDHCEHLGGTVTAIAREKAAVITAGASVVSAQQSPDVAAVLEATCRDRSASLHWVEPLSGDWPLGLPGRIQRSNAAVARGALQALAQHGWQLNDATIRQGFAEASWMGRLQTVLWKGRPVRLDGAHNPPAAVQLAQERLAWPGQELGIPWILAIQAHKQATAMLQVLLQPQDQVWIVPVPDHPSWTRSQLVQSNPGWNDRIHPCDDVETALEDIFKTSSWTQPLPVIAGSLYLLGDLFRRNLVTAE